MTEEGADSTHAPSIPLLGGCVHMIRYSSRDRVVFTVLRKVNELAAAIGWPPIRVVEQVARALGVVARWSLPHRAFCVMGRHSDLALHQAWTRVYTEQ